MIDIVGKKWLYFLFSGIIIVPGIAFLLVWGLKPAIDFTGGTLWEVQNSKFQSQDSREKIQQIIKEKRIKVESIQKTGERSYLLRLVPIDKNQKEELEKEIKNYFGEIKELRFETVGPIIGRETTENAIKAVIIASILIVLYIAWAFRSIPAPYSSFKFGICAVLALIHDILVVTGFFSFFGHYFLVEVDSLFITALLTIMGFSVHDTIVVFDRIRENLRKMPNLSFSQVVNHSILQTLVRSLSTSLTVIFTLFPILLFGGETIRWFIVALLIGIISGTYSSIFTAAPLLVVWEEWGKMGKKEK